MAGLEGLTGIGKSLLDTIVTWGVWGGLVIVGLLVLTVVGVLAYKRKRWNLRTEVKIVGNDGRIIDSENAKGHYAVKEGIVDIKRKGIKASGIKPFDLKKYRQGTKFIEVLQIGANDYLPVHPKSYQVITDEKTGEKYALLEIEGDLSKRKTWTTYMERTGKDRFTLQGLLSKHWRALELGLIMFAMFIGFAVLWTKVGA